MARDELDALVFGPSTDLAPPVECPSCGAPPNCWCNGEAEGTRLSILGIPCVHGRRVTAAEAQSLQTGGGDA